MINAAHLRRLGRSFTVFTLEPGRVRHCVRMVFPIAVSLILTSLILDPSRGAIGLLGAVAINTGHGYPLIRRLRLGIGIIAATLLCEAIGILISPYGWLIPLAMTAVTFAALWLWHGLQIGPPGPINIIFATAIATSMGMQGTTISEMVGTTALAWVIAMFIALILLAFSPHATEESAVIEAEEAVNAYVEFSAASAEASRDASEQSQAAEQIPLSPARLASLRSQAWTAVTDAWHLLRTGRTPGTIAMTTSGRALNARLHAVHLRLLATLRNQSFSLESPEIANHYNIVPMGKPEPRYLLHTAAQYGSRALLVAGRAATAVFLAGAIAYLSPLGHPYWAILASAIVLHMRTSRADLAIRAAHRIVGTSIGLCVYFVIISLYPYNAWLRIVIVLITFYCMEIVITRNYSIAVIFITVFALTMMPVTSEHAVLIIIRDRLVETIIGVCCAILVIWLGNRRAPILLVRRQYRLTLNRIADCLADMAAGKKDQTFVRAQQISKLERIQMRRQIRTILKDPVRAHRRYLVFELGQAGKLLATQISDAPGELARWDAVQREVSAFGYDVVAAAWHSAEQIQAAAQTAAAELDVLIKSLPPISSQNIDPQRVASEVAKIHADFLAAA